MSIDTDPYFTEPNHVSGYRMSGEIRRAFEAIPYSECRVIMADGRWTNQATEADKRRVNGMAPAPYRESEPLRKWAADVVQRRRRSSKAERVQRAARKVAPEAAVTEPPMVTSKPTRKRVQAVVRPRADTAPHRGRPKGLALHRDEIERMRAEGKPWREIGARYGVSYEAVRLVVMGRRKPKA